jgi:hypothetical protein
VRLEVPAAAGAAGILAIDFQGLPTLASTPTAGGWRWGVVATRGDGASRLSALQTGARGRLEFPLQAGDRELFLVVLAAPPVDEQVVWDQPYETIARFPWRVHLSGAKPVLRNPEPPGVAGAPHANGGGWVAATAAVDAKAFVGVNAQVLDKAQVRGLARIAGWAVVAGQAKIGDQAVVRDHAYVTGGSTVSGSARVGAATLLDGQRTLITDKAVVETVMNVIRDKAVSGTAVLFGDVELHRPVNGGRLSGIIAP